MLHFEFICIRSTIFFSYIVKFQIPHGANKCRTYLTFLHMCVEVLELPSVASIAFIRFKYNPLYDFSP